MDRVNFNVPTPIGKELDYILEVVNNRQLSGNGPFSKRCQEMISTVVGGGKVLLTHSCTAALEMAAMLSDIGVGDEVIMPSYTFTSTANAFVLRGAVPVFIDVRADTMNMDESLIEQAITPKTKAICVVHYAGVACDMDVIMEVAERHNLIVIEDAAQAYHATWRGKPLGSFGHFAALSFHETKNIISGEGGALIVNDAKAWERAEIIWEKGTNRASFYRGEVSKYTWVDLGSSFLPSELIAAFLCAQLENSLDITERRLATWRHYHYHLEKLELQGLLRRPIVPQAANSNGHIYYILCPEGIDRDDTIRRISQRNVAAVIHYIPLHSAPAGIKFGRTSGKMTNTVNLSARLIRLPLHANLTKQQQDDVIGAVSAALA
ncbi:dTDP-4-amino-4,6-dideoxygalactose transaminase [Agrobacterium genomosp. 3 str. CIP 111-78]|uniref:dTDP-4-amino-4,6-dideoxygalactose transaminase n=1 Tax=Agrobacterium tumefaciens TaxID=358 RepID=A0AAE6BS78_AGRTU|nr:MULTISPECIES: dTDP-4-amino-4,6-dideoxygalactose transaminase [Agrobacterium tumefaciens complex]MCA2371574.1 dTDP-4-amino-4,6-dideoxygalactose transaminase [Agrobacterium tomkonis CIP 111-78]QCM03081.1 dTDP-4-amino-4,6-dideoxygalactose transaminase [Agrobacterium tumefaciens]